VPLITDAFLFTLFLLSVEICLANDLKLGEDLDDSANFPPGGDPGTEWAMEVILTIRGALDGASTT
jgi:hypothetical protein